MFRRTMAVIAASIALAGGLALAPTPAGAWAWSPNVTLQGTSVCRSVKTGWVWVQASNGESGWATNGTGNYRFNFTRVPTSGMSVTVNFGNGNNRCSTSFGVNRPTTGTSATRNVIQLW